MVKRNRHRFFIEYRHEVLGLRTTHVFGYAYKAYKFLEEHLKDQPDIVWILLETQTPDGTRTYKRISRPSLLDYVGSGNKPRALYKGGK